MGIGRNLNCLQSHGIVRAGEGLLIGRRVPGSEGGGLKEKEVQEGPKWGSRLLPTSSEHPNSLTTNSVNTFLVRQNRFDKLFFRLSLLLGRIVFVAM